MAQRMTNPVANAMAVAMLQNMAHSTPLHSTISVQVSCGVSGYPSIRRNGYLQPAVGIEWML